MLATLAIMYLVPFPFYGVFQALGLVEMPEGGNPAEFLLSVLVIKIGVAFAFVLLFRLASSASRGSWWRYAAIWWVMFALIEVGQAMGPGYSVWEAVAGVLSEAVYFPLSSLATARILGGGPAPPG
jgi:hypothetical protein